MANWLTDWEEARKHPWKARLFLLVGRRRPPLRRRPSRVRQPRLAPSYARAHATILVFWRRHPDLAWYVAGGALAAGGALVVAGWG